MAQEAEAFVCTDTGFCDWHSDSYVADVHWRYHSAGSRRLQTPVPGGIAVDDCKRQCLAAFNCTGIEWPVDSSYCLLWLNGRCHVDAAAANWGWTPVASDTLQTCTLEGTAVTAAAAGNLSAALVASAIEGESSAAIMVMLLTIAFIAVMTVAFNLCLFAWARLRPSSRGGRPPGFATDGGTTADPPEREETEREKRIRASKSKTSDLGSRHPETPSRMPSSRHPFPIPRVKLALPRGLAQYEDDTSERGAQRVKELARELEAQLESAGRWTETEMVRVDALVEQFKAYNFRHVEDRRSKVEDLKAVLVDMVRIDLMTYTAARQDLLERDAASYDEMKSCAAALDSARPEQFRSHCFQLPGRLAEVYAAAVGARERYRRILPKIFADTSLEVPEIPPLKSLFRSLEKMALQEWSPRGLLDVVRCRAVCESMAQHHQILTNLSKLHEELAPTRVKQRYANGCHGNGGWSDVLLNFVFREDESQHHCELQICHLELMALERGVEGRSAAEELLQALIGRAAVDELLSTVRRPPGPSGKVSSEQAALAEWHIRAERSASQGGNPVAECPPSQGAPRQAHPREARACGQEKDRLALQRLADHLSDRDAMPEHMDRGPSRLVAVESVLAGGPRFDDVFKNKNGVEEQHISDGTVVDPGIGAARTAARTSCCILCTSTGPSKADAVSRKGATGSGEVPTAMGAYRL